MNPSPSLVILAAGLGSRYGGPKQLDTVGPSEETILDYTIYDAIKVGFKKIVFVIKEELEGDFKKVFYNNWSQLVEIRFVYQKLENLPNGYEVPKNRVKPWGTAHAVLMAESEIEESFAIVNADDFYGRLSLKLIHDQLVQVDKKEFAARLVGFDLKNTLSENGSVSRGLCKLNAQDNLTEIVERTNIYKGSPVPYYEEGEKIIALTGNEIVSMNLMGFSPTVFDLIRHEFKDFLDKNNETADLKAEFYIPLILDSVRRKGIDIPISKSTEKWFGVTYKEDKQEVVDRLKQLVDNDTYPTPLWN